MNHTTTHARWRVLPVHLVAKLFGVRVHVEGLPHGLARDRSALLPILAQAINCALDRHTDPEVDAKMAAIAFKAGLDAFDRNLKLTEPKGDPFTPPQRPLGADGLVGCQEVRHSPVCIGIGDPESCHCRFATSV